MQISNECQAQHSWPCHNPLLQSTLFQDKLVYKALANSGSVDMDSARRPGFLPTGCQERTAINVCLCLVGHAQGDFLG